MDIERYIDLALDTLEKAGLYYEIPKGPLKQMLIKHFEDKYLFEMEVLTKQISFDSVNGSVWTSTQYDAAMDKITNKLLGEIYDLALTDPSMSIG